MAVSLTTNLNAQLIANLQNTFDLGTAQFPLSLPSLLAITLASGTGANKANLLFSDARTLAATVSEDFDMYAMGGVTDPIGVAYTFATVKILIIQNLAAVEADSLTIGNKATSAAWTSPFNDNEDRVKIPGGGTLMLVAPGATGYTVTNTTNYLLKILNNSASNSVTYNIIIIGATA